MKLEHEIKKIMLDANLKPTATVEFSVCSHKDLEEFKSALVKFVNDMKGQKQLKT